MKKSNNWLPLKALVIRNVKLFMKDKMMVFFSVLAPVIVLLLYILFLGEMQVQNIQQTIQNTPIDGVDLSNIDAKTIESGVRAVINNWMIAGVMSVSCITVAFNANTMMVRDRERGNINDVLSAPIPRWVVYLSYIISCIIITSFICFSVLFLSMIYLTCTGGFMMSFVNFLAIVGTTLLSIISSSFIMVLIISLIKTEGALTSFNSVFSAVIGFLIGAYMPIGMLPKGVQYLCLFIPGTYSSGLFRNVFMEGPISKLGAQIGISREQVNELLKSFSVNMDFFGMDVSSLAMILVLVGSIVLFAALLLIFYSNKKTNYFTQTKKRKKKKFSVKEEG